MGEPPPIVSIPGLAAALRSTDRWHFLRSTTQSLHSASLAPVYQIGSAGKAVDSLQLTVEEEVAAAVESLQPITDRLRRLAMAYGEWAEFDPDAFFDLFPAQSRCLVRVSEGVRTVHVSFYTDLLLPSFQQTERFWSHSFVPAYQAARPGILDLESESPFLRHFRQEIHPQLVTCWQRTLTVAEGVRQLLTNDLAFLATLAGEEERYRWRAYWGQAAPGLDPSLLSELAQLPTLTLSTTFPLPAYRQPGRTRRLRRTWLRSRSAREK